MAIEIRPCRDREELKAYGDVIAYAFAINDPSELDAELEAVEPAWTTCAFEDGKVVSTLGTMPFTVRLNGRPVQMGGITGVGTLPGSRRQGLLRRTMTAALHRLHDEDTPFALLWASMGAIYQRFGYGIATPMFTFSFDPRAVELLPEYVPGGSCRLIDLDKAKATLAPIYERFAAPRNLLLNRSDYLWDWGTLRRKRDEALYVAVYRNVHGDATGYVVYKTREEDPPRYTLPPQVLQVVDIAWLDLDAYAGIWEYLRGHDMVREIRMRWLAAEDDPMPLMLLEPRALNAATFDGTWLRVVDVAKGLAARPYGAPGRLRIAVRDDLCPWNEGTWELETDGPTATVRPTTEPEDLAMPVASLATLLTGHRNATTLERAGRIAPASQAALRLADTMFATDFAPYTPNMF